MQRRTAARLHLAALAATLGTMTAGCEAPDTTLLAPTRVPSADPAVRPMVIPSQPPVESLQLTIEDERSMARLAKPLRTTVEELIADNKLASTELKRGMTLRVRTTAQRLERYRAQRAARQVRKAAKERRQREQRTQRKLRNSRK